MKRKQLEQCAWDATPPDERQDRVEHRVGAKYRGRFPADRIRISEPRQRIRKLTGNSREIRVFDPTGSTPGTMSPWMPLWSLFNDELRQRCDQGIEPKMRKPYSRTRPDYKSSIEGDEPEVGHATKRSSKKSPAQLDREIAETLAGKAAVRPGAMSMAYVVPGARVPIPAISAAQHDAFEAQYTKKGKWSVVVEDGYVMVKRDGETIAAGIDVGGKRLRDIEFMRPEYQKSNPTRQKAMRMLQEKGYR